MDKHYKETILARWAAGDLTDEERKELESSGDNKILEKITQHVDRWSLPELKNNYYQDLQTKLQGREQVKVIPLYRNKMVLSIAASLLLLVGLTLSYRLFFYANYIEYRCEAGQKLKINLPDNTSVMLNGQSSIKFDETGWLENRVVALEGEGYFEVNKKGPFKVKFQKGDVDVLGTRFNIMSGTDIATVKCYEGKVSVTIKEGLQQILTKGMAARLLATGSIDTFAVQGTIADWQNGENSFIDAPLLEVINALSIQYNTPFDISNSIDLNRKFTGKFIHSDLNTALNMVFTPMGIQ